MIHQTVGFQTSRLPSLKRPRRGAFLSKNRIQKSMSNKPQGSGNMERIGYARVSTDDQHLDLQRDALTRAGCRVIFEEKASGKSAERPERCRRSIPRYCGS